MMFDAYNESNVLFMATVERYFERPEHYPECVLADKIYRNRNTFLTARSTEFAYHVRPLVDRRKMQEPGKRRNIRMAMTGLQ